MATYLRSMEIYSTLNKLFKFAKVICNFRTNQYIQRRRKYSSSFNHNIRNDYVREFERNYS